MTRTRRTTVIGWFFVLAGVAIAAQQPPRRRLAIRSASSR